MYKVTIYYDENKRDTQTFDRKQEAERICYLARTTGFITVDDKARQVHYPVHRVRMVTLEVADA